jgi:hypothetical protein
LPRDEESGQMRYAMCEEPDGKKDPHVVSASLHVAGVREGPSVSVRTGESRAGLGYGNYPVRKSNKVIDAFTNPPTV